MISQNIFRMSSVITNTLIVFIMGLDKLNFAWVFNSRHELIFAIDHPKNVAYFRRGQKLLKNIHLLTFTMVESKSATFLN